jgi:hypothetical protein
MLESKKEGSIAEENADWSVGDMRHHVAESLCDGYRLPICVDMNLSGRKPESLYNVCSLR